ncbi:MAG: hypothetical protein Q8936_08090 [Bacillota bacterium]|nr:hypothetical protein [Bacillota bacterium]
MAHRKVIDTYYTDISNLSELLNKLVNSYRLLIGGAAELNQITLAKKSEVRDALKRIDALGDIIDDVINALEYSQHNYNIYCKLKADVMKMKVQPEYVQTEIDDELKLKNEEHK